MLSNRVHLTHFLKLNLWRHLIVASLSFYYIKPTLWYQWTCHVVICYQNFLSTKSVRCNVFYVYYFAQNWNWKDNSFLFMKISRNTFRTPGVSSLMKKDIRMTSKMAVRKQTHMNMKEVVSHIEVVDARSWNSMWKKKAENKFNLHLFCYKTT